MCISRKSIPKPLISVELEQLRVESIFCIESNPISLFLASSEYVLMVYVDCDSYFVSKSKANQGICNEGS